MTQNESPNFLFFFGKMIDKRGNTRYNNNRRFRAQMQDGGIAQLARAFGSYPECHWFKSSYRYQLTSGLHRFVSIVGLRPLDENCTLQAVVRSKLKQSRRFNLLRSRPGRTIYCQRGALVKWLRHRPFTPVTRVRVPYASPSQRAS